jgi:peptide/nickel transport system substrate-binding protein
VGRSDEGQSHLLDALGRRQFLGGVAAAGAVAGAGSLLAACGGSSGGGGTSPSASSAGSTGTSGTPKRGGSMSVGMTGGSPDTDTLDPHGGLTYLDTARAHSLYNPLYQLDHNAQPVYVLAEDNGIEANNKNTADWIIKLRPGVTFHDNKDLTADDVIYTFKRIINGGMGGKNSLGPMNLAKLKADSKTSVRVTFDQPYGSFRDQLAYWYYLYIIPEGFDPAKNPGKANGTGPFKLQSFTKGQQSVMVRNENYFHSGKPYLDKLTIIDFSDSSSMQNALTTGAIDAAGGIEGPQVAALAGNPAVKTVVSKTGAITPFTMRVDIKPFNDVRVRQALRYLVDRQQLIDSALNGFATVGADVFSPFDPAYKGYTRQADIPKAKGLLKAAGYGDNNPLQITLTTSPVATGTVSMATVLAQQAKAAGVQIKVDNVSPGKFFSSSYLKWDFSQDFWNFSPYLAQCAQSMQPHSPFNETHTDNPTLNNLYKQANQTPDDDKRKQFIQQMMDYDFSNGGYIIPAFISALDAYSTKLAGYTPARVGQPLDDFNFEDFYFA